MNETFFLRFQESVVLRIFRQGIRYFQQHRIQIQQHQEHRRRHRQQPGRHVRQPRANRPVLNKHGRSAES